jgi:hypothetical protein
MALYIPRNIFHLARLLYVRPETSGPTLVFPFDCTTALGSNQPQVKMSTRNIHGGKGGRCARQTTSPSSRAECHKIWKPKSPGTPWATAGLSRDCFTFLAFINHNRKRFFFLNNINCLDLAMGKQFVFCNAKFSVVTLLSQMSDMFLSAHKTTLRHA